MQDLNDLYYFVHVVDHGGFAPAGRALGVPKSKLSRRIALLEDRLGVRLIQRSSRRFSVTEPGLAYYGHAKAALVEAAAAEEAILRQGSEPRGTVRMSCPVTLLDTDVGPMVAEFLGLHPQVSLHLDATNRRVDVIGEGLDVALRVRPPPLEDSDLVMRVLATRRQCLVASPRLLARRGQPETRRRRCSATRAWISACRRTSTSGTCTVPAANTPRSTTSRASSPAACWPCAMRQWPASASSSCRRW